MLKKPLRFQGRSQDVVDVRSSTGQADSDEVILTTTAWTASGMSKGVEESKSTELVSTHVILVRSHVDIDLRDDF